ncbi:MAG TPA: PQQ-binding-like beta-propeller repeat protein [Pirellulaceae bacterium]
MKISLAILSAFAFASITYAASTDQQPKAKCNLWSQFRGPGGSGIADGQHPPIEIGPDKNVKWKVDAPAGSSSPIVVGDMLVMTAFDVGKLYTIAYDRGDGHELWRAEAPAAQIELFQKNEGSPAAPTSASDGKRIVSYFGSCGLFCYDLTGKELWRHELPTVTTVGDFGTGVSPILVDDAVILLRDEMKDPTILALDAATGRVKWEKKRQSRSGFSTPAVWDAPNGKQIIAAGYGQMIAYDLTTGDEVWHVDGMPSVCCASPVVAADGTLYFAGWSPGDARDKDFKMPSFDELLAQNDADANHDGILSKEESQKTMIKDFFENQDQNHDGLLTRDEWEGMLKYISAAKNSAFALKLGGVGNITETNVLWQKTTGLPYVASGIFYRGQYVLVKDGGIVTAYDAKSGDVLYTKRAAAAGSYYASPVAADGHIYIASLADGAITVLKAGADQPEVVAQNPPLGERLSATPAIVDDTLYVRTAGHLYAFANP